jgi:hypothetical protein
MTTNCRCFCALPEHLIDAQRVDALGGFPLWPIQDSVQELIGPTRLSLTVTVAQNWSRQPNGNGGDQAAPSADDGVAADPV